GPCWRWRSRSWQPRARPRSARAGHGNGAIFLNSALFRTIKNHQCPTWVGRGRMRFVLFVAWFLLVALASPASAAKRVALVIGNGAYQNVAKLPNPAKDAAAIADMFKKAGFEWVKVRQDVGNLEFRRALREFNDAAHDADVAVVYYAGHGIQAKD